jgi:hypothetical protein
MMLFKILVFKDSVASRSIKKNFAEFKELDQLIESKYSK